MISALDAAADAAAIDGTAPPACRNGHPWTASNTYVHPASGNRECRACRRRRARRARWRARMARMGLVALPFPEDPPC